MSTFYSQRDDNHCRVHLGTSQRTINQDGCLLCDIATALNRYCDPTNPAKLNRWLCLNNGYINQNRFVFNSVDTLGMRLALIADYRKAPANVDELQHYIYRGYIVIVSVAFNPYRKGAEHWLLACGFDNQDLTCIDPWVMPSENPYVGILSHYSKPSWNLARTVLRFAAYDFDQRDIEQTAF